MYEWPNKKGLSNEWAKKELNKLQNEMRAVNEKLKILIEKFGKDKIQK
jgi:hypothetical protein